MSDIDYNALCERLDRHWLTNTYPTGPASTLEEVVADCRKASAAIRELGARLAEVPQT